MKKSSQWIYNKGWVHFWEIQFQNYAFSALVTATRDALAERLESIRGTASSLYNRMMENMEYGRQRLKDIVEKEAEEEAKE